MDITSNFETVDLSEFFTEEESSQEPMQTGIIVFTNRQQALIDELKQKLSEIKYNHFEILEKRVSDLKQLAKAIAAFPSLLERADLTVGSRTPHSLIRSLIDSTREGDTTLQLPSKATLGKGFLVSKLHTFSSLEKLAKQAELDESLCKEFHDETVSMMFLLLAEDVYLNLIHDTSLSEDARWQLATSLLLLWEHRADQNIADISPVLQAVWNARAKLAPAFGTMMGTSELMTITFALDEQWVKFITTKLSDDNVKMAMEEFLFGISYEDILRLKNMLREKGISAIGRNEVPKYLGNEFIKTEFSDYRDFFQQYSIRRDNARVRNRLKLPGPHKTLEDYFICFVIETNIEIQKNDAAAQKI